MPLLLPPLKQNLADAEKLNMSFPFTGEPPLNLQMPQLPEIPKPVFPVIPDNVLKFISSMKWNLASLADWQTTWLAATFKVDKSIFNVPKVEIPKLPALPTIPSIPNIPDFSKLKDIPSLQDAQSFITGLIKAEMLLDIPSFGSTIKLPQIPTPPPLPAMPNVSYDPKTLMSRIPNPNLKPPVLPQLPTMPTLPISVGDIPKLMQISLPPTPKAMAMNFAMAYHRWVLQSMPMAGPLMLDPSRLSMGVVLLAAQLQAVPFMLGWGPGLISYWNTANWIGPGYIPINPVMPTSLMPPFGVATEIAQWVAGSGDNPPGSYDAAAGRLATILYKYTLKIQVITTTVPPMGSVVAIVPIV